MLALSALFALAGWSAAPESAAPLQVPVERAPYHRLVFANDDLAVIETLVPPGGDSGFHLHSRDLFYVVIQPARAGTQRPGQPERMVPTTFVTGSAGMNPISVEPFVHRVFNPDVTPYRLIAVELRRDAPLGRPITDRPEQSGFKLVQDHPRLRAWRLVLEPGQSVPPLAYAGTGVRIYVRGSQLTVSGSDRPDQKLLVAAGNFEQLQPGPSVALKNSGETPVELIDVELK